MRVFDRVFCSVIIVFALAGSALAQAGRASAPPPLVRENTVVKLSDHTYAIPDEKVPFVPNAGFVVGNRATLIIDTGLGTRNGQTIVREARKLSKSSEIYVVATHFHPEHAGGAGGFPASATFIRSRIQQKELEEMGEEYLERFRGFTPMNRELLEKAEFRAASILFDSEHVLDLGGVRARIFNLGTGTTHTRGDTLVFVEGDGVLFAGDVVMNRNFLAFSREDSSGSAWLAALEKLEPLRPAKIVPAHGPVGDGSLIAAQKEYLRSLQARVQELKRQGKSADEVAKTVSAEFQAKYKDWDNPNRVEAAARSFYRETS